MKILLQWYGDSANGLKHWHYEANTLEELYNRLISEGVIPYRKIDPIYKFEEYKGYSSKKFSDADWVEFISNQNINAYYQTFEYSNNKPIKLDENGMLIPISEKPKESDVNIGSKICSLLFI